MSRIYIKDKAFDLFIPEQEIKQAIERMAKQMAVDYEGANPLFVGILNGAFMFVSELMGCLNGGYELTFARYSSYNGITTTGLVNEIMPISTPLKGRHVVLLEDIIDSGYTMQSVMGKLHTQGAASVRLATMLFKPTALKCDIKPDYVGIEIPNDFIVGHGLDYDECGRCYRDIYKLVQ